MVYDRGKLVELVSDCSLESSAMRGVRHSGCRMRE